MPVFCLRTSSCALAAAAALSLAACAPEKSAPPTRADQVAEAAPSGAGPAGEICRYGPRPRSVYVATRHSSGQAYQGDMQADDIPKMNPNWFGSGSSLVATAIAAPGINIWRVQVNDNCYDARRKVYYSCTKTLSADLRNIRALVRAESYSTARKLAVDLCEQRVLQRIADKVDVRIDHRKLRCRIVQVARCPLPKGTPKTPGAGKKKAN